MKRRTTLIISFILSLGCLVSCIADSEQDNPNDPYNALSDAECVAADKSSLSIGFNGSDDESSVTQDIILATSGLNGTTISWNSDNTTSISNDGSVTRPGYLDGDADVELTATIVKNSVSDTRNFYLTVIRVGETVQDRVDADTTELDIVYNGSDNATNVTQDVTLSSTGTHGSTISWISNNDTVITGAGEVINPLWGSGTAAVALTATISQTGATSRQKTFNLTVPAQHYVYVATGNGVSISTNNGVSWPDRLYGSIGSVKAVYASGTDVYATGGTSLYISEDNGDTWTYDAWIYSMDPVGIYGVYGSGSYLYVGGYDCTYIYNGNSWSGGTPPWSYFYASGSYVYAAAFQLAGVYVSENYGSNWTHYTTDDGLGSNDVNGIHASVSNIYAATDNGLSIHNSYFDHWDNYTTTNGLASNTVNGVWAVGSTVYAATSAGLSVSTNNGTSYTITYTTANGLGSNALRGVVVIGNNIYVATSGGLSISRDGGSTWRNYTITDGLRSNSINCIFVQ